MNQAASTPSGWRKAFTTPISQLLRGRITGPLTLLDMLDTSEIPSAVVDAMQVILKPLSKRLRSQATRQLVLSCKKQLQAGRTESQLLEQLDNTKNITSLIRKTRTASWVFDFNLSDKLWSTITAIVDQSRRQKAAVMNCICRGFQSQLQAGRTDDDLVSQYSDAIAIGKMIQQTKSPEIFLASDLPDNVVHVVLDVVKRTRLWPAEKSETAQELFAHFTDGLAQGSSAEELIASFGCLKTSAKLIRRASIRKRSLAWHTWRRTWQTTAAFFAIILVTWTTLAARFMLAEPTIKYDLIQQFDDKSRAIPENERAWPLYRKGIMLIKRHPGDQDREYRKAQSNIREGLRDGPKSQYWADAKSYMEKHAKAFDLFLEATTRPQLGFINRDLNNKEWLKKSGFLEPYQLNPPRVAAFNTGLPQVDDFNWFVKCFFGGEFHLATERENSSRCLQILIAQLVFAEHCIQSAECVVCRSVSNWQVVRTAELVSKLVKEQPEFLGDEQLKLLAKGLAEVELIIPSNTFLDKSMIDDFLQRSYTDDGSENGRFTRRGFQLLKPNTFSSLRYTPEKKFLLELAFPFALIDNKTRVDSETTNYQVMVAPVASVIADRKQMQDKLLDLLQLLEQVDDVDQFEDSAYMTEYRRLYDSPRLRLKYLPALILMPDSVETFWTQAKIPLVQRDSALVLIAAEFYRRSHGEFPAAAAELVPEFLAEIPIDPYSKQPLRYSIQEGRPHIDSEGLRLFEETK